MNLQYWLRKTPQPSAVLADEKRIEVPKNARAWRDLTATIKSLEPSKLTALDGQGNVIRSVVLESDDDKAPVSPEMSDLQLFAKLLAEAYEKGSKSNQPVIDSAMQFVERQSERLTAAEKECDRLRGVVHKQAMQIAELRQPPADGEGTIVDAMLAGALQAQALNSGANGANGNGANSANGATKKAKK
jgi:hypothetical protein